MSEESHERVERMPLSLKYSIMPSMKEVDFEAAIRKAESLIEDSLIIIASLTNKNGILIKTHSSEVISAFNDLTKEAKEARTSGKLYYSSATNYKED